MSKIQLKRELTKLDRDQLIQLVLDIYSARKEAKDYFDFFVEPDIEKLTEKYRSLIHKEMIRGKYSKSTARISRIRAYIKDYASYGVDAEAVVELMIYTLSVGLLIQKTKYVSQPFESGLKKMAEDVLKFGDKNCIFDSSFRLLEEVLSGKYGYVGFVNAIRTHLEWSKT